MMYQKLWNKFPNDDIFIMHADMFPLEEDEDNEWFGVSFRIRSKVSRGRNVWVSSSLPC